MLKRLLIVFAIVLLILAVIQVWQIRTSQESFFNKLSPQGVSERKPEISEGGQATFSGQISQASESAQVKQIIDGDTIELTGGRKLRYIGMDTAELSGSTGTNGCFAQEAAEANRGLVEGKIVRLEKDISETDKYGRLLRYVYVGGVMVNEELVRLGFAKVATYPPDVKYKDKFLIAEKEARENKRGLWSNCP